jgi:lysophospholipase
MQAHHEGFIDSFDGSKLYFQLWDNKSDTLVLVTHGHGEHSGCYMRVVDALAPTGASVIAWDLRGHGKSDGLRGYAVDFYEYSKDLEFLIMQLGNQKIVKFKKLILFAHSMGGLIQTAVVAGSMQKFEALVFSSPLFGISMQVPFMKELASVIAESFLPKLTLGTGIDYDKLTRDDLVKKEYELDNLRHQKMSAGVFLGIQKSFKNVSAILSQLKVPTLVQIPESDPVVDSDKTKQCVEIANNPGIQMKIYPGRRHELYNDLNRDEVFRDLAGFIKAHI